MDSFTESRPVIPRMLSALLAAVFASTAVFMIVMKYVFGSDIPEWSIAAVAAVFALISAACFLIRFEVTVTEDDIRIRYILKRITIPFDTVIDKKTGDMTAIRNYGSWNLKGVKHKTYSAVGEESGVALKLTGKRVVVISSGDPGKLFSLIPTIKEAGE